MDQEAEEGKGKAGADKQGKVPQVSEHAAWMMILAYGGSSAMLWGCWGYGGSQGMVYSTLRGLESCH